MSHALSNEIAWGASDRLLDLGEKPPPNPRIAFPVFYSTSAEQLSMGILMLNLRRRLKWDIAFETTGAITVSKPSFWADLERIHDFAMSVSS